MYILPSNITANTGENVDQRSRTMHCWQLCTLPFALMKINVDVSQNLQRAFLHDPVMLLLGTDPKESGVQVDIKEILAHHCLLKHYLQ